MPRVSICLPSLNHRRFLPERLDSIFGQSFGDWELIVVDGYSDDGSGDFFRRHAATEPRLRLFQAPREGIYPAWNRCLRHATGDYVYIAPSDDTMAPDCLERLVEALDARADCDLAHCALRAVGAGAEELNAWWKARSLFALGSNGLAQRSHLRLAPYDGLLHLYGESVYTSVTQLLIRRSLFAKIGVFDAAWGNAGDFHWSMRASLVTNTVHVPHTWGGWRLHAGQATQMHAIAHEERREQLEHVIDDALRQSWSRLPRSVQRGLVASWRRFFWHRWELRRGLAARPSRGGRAGYLISQAAKGSPAPWSYVGDRLRTSFGSAVTPGDTVSDWLRSAGAACALVELH